MKEIQILAILLLVHGGIYLVVALLGLKGIIPKEKSMFYGSAHGFSTDVMKHGDKWQKCYIFYIKRRVVWSVIEMVSAPVMYIVSANPLIAIPIFVAIAISTSLPAIETAKFCSVIPND